MSRPRKKENIVNQPRITEYFNERKTRKRPLDDLKNNEKSTTKKSNASNLLISVLKKETNLKAQMIINEKNPNLRENTDSSTFDKPKSKPEKIDLPANQIEKESDVISTESKKDSASQIVESSKLERNTQTPASEESRKQAIGENMKINLPLPERYKFLLRVFSCIDSVAMILYKKGIVVTFTKLQPSLENNFGSTAVNLNHLGQIHTVFPEAFSFKRKEILPISDSNKKAFDVVLLPNFGECNLEEVLSKRKKKFYHKLLEIVENEHENFLKETSKSSSVIGKIKIHCWHPNFVVENCKEIKVSDLEVFKETKMTSPKQVLDKVIGCLKTKSNLQKPTDETPENVSKQVDKKDANLRKLPIVAKIINSIFQREKKNVLTLIFVIEKLQSSPKMKLENNDELKESIRLISDVVPNWVHIFNLGKVDRVRINKDIPFENVQKRLENFK